MGRILYQDSKIFSLLIAIASQESNITQTYLKQITGWSASQISEVIKSMTREGLIIPTKITGSRKNHYQLTKSLLEIYETNFIRIFQQFKSSFSIPSELERRFRQLALKFPKSLALDFFWKYLGIYTQGSNRIIELMSNFSLNHEKILPRSQIEAEITKLSLKFTTLLYNSNEFLKRQEKDKPNEPLELELELIELMKEYLLFFRKLMLILERDVDAGLILNTFFINYYPLTQEDLIKLTNISHSSVSRKLFDFKAQNLVVEIKIPGERRNYYHVAFPRESFLFGKQLKALQLSFQMEKIVVKTKKKLLANDALVITNEGRWFLEYLETTEIAFGRMNTQMLEILQKLGKDLGI